MRSPLRASAVMAAGTSASRVLGFVRASLLAAAIGLTGASADAFDLANTIPNAVYMLVAGGVLNAVLVPQVVRAARQPDGGRAYTDRLLTACVAGLAVLTACAVLAVPWLVDLTASDAWGPERVALATAFGYWCLPQVFFYGTYTLLGQVLNARGSFGPYMWAPVINNVVSIAGIAVLLVLLGGDEVRVADWSPSLVAVLAGTSTLGVVAQAAVLLPALRRSGFGYRPAWGLRGYGLRSASRVAVWTFAAVLLGQAQFVLFKRITSTGSVAEGVSAGNTAYSTAYVLFMLPHSIIAVSLATALFTRMSSQAAAADVPGLRRSLADGAATILAGTAVCAAGLVALAGEVTAVLFPGNDRAETAALAPVVAALALGLPAFSTTYLVQRVFYAFEDARTPFAVQAVVIATASSGALAAASLLPPRMVVTGVALAMASGHLVGAVVGVVLVRRRLGSVHGREVLRTAVRIVLAALLAAGVARGLASGTAAVLGDGRPAVLVALVVAGCGLLATYVAACRAMRVREVADVLDAVAARLPGGGARRRR